MATNDSPNSKTLVAPWLLISTPQLTDPNFSRTVVLILEHDDRGALGFVLNRPLRTPMSRLLRLDEAAEDIPAWYGGPVGTEQGVVLQWRPGETPSGVSVSGDDAAIKALIASTKERGDLLYPARFLVGYAGWGGGQLDEEIRQGAWLESPMCTELAFATEAPKLWRAALERLGVGPRLTVVVPKAQELPN